MVKEIKTSTPNPVSVNQYIFTVRRPDVQPPSVLENRVFKNQDYLKMGWLDY
jgi:hypothetical protein